jgi:hypothetical protein
MWFKGFFSGTWEDLYLPLKGVLGTEGTRFEDEVQVVGSTHSTDEVPPMRDGGKGWTGRCIEEGRQCRAQNLEKHCQGN